MISPTRKREISPEFSGSPCKKKDTDHGELQSKRLPNPCPIPPAFTPAVYNCIIKKEISGNLKYRMLRESASFYYGLCPDPTPSEYQEMAKSLCNKYPMLQVVNCTEYWVKKCACMQQCNFNNAY